MDEQVNSRKSSPREGSAPMVARLPRILRAARWCAGLAVILVTAGLAGRAATQPAEGGKAKAARQASSATSSEALPPDATLSGQAQPPKGDMAWWYRAPAAKFWEGLPIGNGRFAAMVYGRVRDEVVPFNDETLWTGQPYNPVNPEGLTALPEIRRLMLGGKFIESSELAGKLLSYPAINVQTYQAMARLHVRFDGHDAAQDYRRELDMDSALARVSYRIGDAHFAREAFASYPDQVVVLRITCDRPGRISLTTRLSSLHPSAVSRTVGQDAVLIEGGVATAVPQIPSLMRWEGLARVRAEGGTVRALEGAAGAGVRVERADAVTIILAGATNYKNWRELGADPHARCEAYLKGVADRSYAELRERHVQDYQPQFRACKFDLGGHDAARQDTTTRLENLRKGGDDPLFTTQYFQYGRYLLLAGSRPGGLAFNNHNKWLDDLEGRWRGRYTLNINIQECYWPAESANLPRTTDALLSFIQALAESGTRTARELYGCRGWVAHHGTDIWMNTAPTDKTNYVSPMMGVWVVQSLWEHYRFDPDPKYLARIYPLIKGAAQFARDYLVEEPKHKWLVSCPAESPENLFLIPGEDTKCSLSAGPAIDSQLVRDIFGECIEASAALGVDEPLRQDLSAALKRLPPNRIGKFGQIMEWLDEYPEVDPKHRHVSQLYAAYPSDQITRRGTPELAAAVARTLERRGDNRGWSAAWKINLWARLGDAEAAYRIARRMQTEISIHPAKEDSDRVPSLEGNQGIQAYTSGLVEMLVQSHAGEIELLPALPAAWPTGAAQGLRARGGFSVDLAWQAGQLKGATVRAKYAGPCRLRTPGAVEVRHGGQAVATRRIDAETVEFSAVAGGEYAVAPPSQPLKSQ